MRFKPRFSPRGSTTAGNRTNIAKTVKEPYWPHSICKPSATFREATAAFRRQKYLPQNRRDTRLEPHKCERGINNFVDKSVIGVTSLNNAVRSVIAISLWLWTASGWQRIVSITSSCSGLAIVTWRAPIERQIRIHRLRADCVLTRRCFSLASFLFGTRAFAVRYTTARRVSPCIGCEPPTKIEDHTWQAQIVWRALSNDFHFSATVQSICSYQFDFQPCKTKR